MYTAGFSFAGGPIGKTFVAVTVVSFALFASVPNDIMIHFLNILALAVSGGCMLAYFPVAYNAYMRAKPTMGDLFAFGTFCGWFGFFLSRVVSLTGRTHWGKWIMDTDVVSWFIVLILICGMCHLNAPEIEAGRLPPEQWRKVGIGFTVAVLFAAVLMQFNILVLS